MSDSIYTYLWLSPKDYARKNIRAILDDDGASFEFDDDEKPDENGMIKLNIQERETYNTMTTMRNFGVPFYAEYDSRTESDGDRFLFVSYRLKSVFIHENGEGCPAVPVPPSGKIDPKLLKGARDFWKMYAKVKTACKKKLEPKGAE